ncbi:ubiquinone biosynthesis regulatory protein kinase UbiB [Aestuariirhabdus sp. Z084]|uniref:ubiquinone biosynthesis regulatory protein kinase UbiB n=1 Tax=Aestuariirhabdus haliotis TaxID=2918751 RepID=UPI00201B3B08|nr:ubiquinone biosynthesis regulatory protein kinase UbiB [Aestuariirhabdus haliotis]MCL6414970.1 ubiquinone biosynthesis regulatory protein kinase UbiB [Aestuariirhabdus haliotis]MCL6418902.1 ubiquinone biosynthesis regulatory protein kinase UbiB [Aestuariirhabdus haliotis]
MQQLRRLFRILWVIGRYRLDDLLQGLELPWYLRLLRALSPWRFSNSQRSRGERLRLALEELGPIFVKFGQLLSTRRDLLPDDIADELVKLQDQVPPFCTAEAQRIIEQELGQPVDQLFARFDTKELASASVAQVHSAQLHSGEEVVVKVVRPNIEQVIRKDIKLLYLMAQLISRLSDDGRRLRPVEVVSDYEHTIMDELDMQLEAANASALRRNFESSKQLYVPEVHWSYCAQRVLTLERIYGVPIGDVERLKELGIDMKTLAEYGVEIFFTQVFRDAFFHADMHPGNIFVDIADPKNPRYIALDFGIVGSLNPDDQSYLARNLLAFFKQDYRRVAQLHIDSGWVPAETRVNELEAAIRGVCEPIFAKPLSEISFGQLLLKLFQTARRFDMEVQPQLVLLEKTLLNIEGLGRQLYPELDLWQTAYPYLERWMKQRIGPRGLLRALREQAPEWAEQAPHVPQLIFNLLQEQNRAIQHPPAQPVQKPRWPGKALGAGAIIGALLSASPQLPQLLSNGSGWQSIALLAIGFYLIAVK